LAVHTHIATVPAIGLCRIDHLTEIVFEVAEPESPLRALSAIIARVGLCENFQMPDVRGRWLASAPGGLS
jgi:hypothetical protein